MKIYLCVQSDKLRMTGDCHLSPFLMFILFSSRIITKQEIFFDKIELLKSVKNIELLKSVFGLFTTRKRWTYFDPNAV